MEGKGGLEEREEGRQIALRGEKVEKDGEESQLRFEREWEREINEDKERETKNEPDTDPRSCPDAEDLQRTTRPCIRCRLSTLGSA